MSKRHRKNQTRQVQKQPIPSYLVSIVIPNYGRFDLLEKCLAAIPDAFGDLSYEVILVENGSPLEEKKKFFASATLPPNTRVIELSKNVGYPGACNRGYRNASGALFFILTNDVIMAKGAGEQLVRTMDDPMVGVCGMKLVFPSDAELTDAGLKHSEVQRNPNSIQHVGLFTAISGDVIHMYLGWRADHPKPNAVKEAHFVTGAAFMTRKILFRDLGGFDEIYGDGTYEDVDYCMKVREKGLKIMVNTSAVGVHYTGATAEKFQKAFPLNQNRNIFNQRWYNKLAWTEWWYW